MNYVEFTLTCQEWSPIKILRPVPTGDDPWGILAPLRETPWGENLPVVSGEVMSDAQYGHVMPLVRLLGLPPDQQLKRIPVTFRMCLSSKQCISYRQQDCHPCAKLPDCYTPPSIPHAAQEAAVLVAMAWRENRYVIIVEGSEFSL